MASSSRPAGGVDITALRTQLYEHCVPLVNEDPKIVFHQSGLLDLDVIPNDDINLLLKVVQGLVDDKLFKLVSDNNSVGWKLRTIDEAKKYKSLTNEQEIVYTIIDEAGEHGAWSRNIKIRANIHDAVFTSAIKHLETKRMITTMKSVEFPSRKMYIKTTIRPSERATGGPWYSDGELDEVFIDMVMKHLFYFIREKTFHVSKKEKSALKQPKKVVKGKKPTTEEIKAANKAREDVLGPRQSSQVAKQDVESAPLLRDPQAAIAHIFPFPAGYNAYPTLDQCTYYIENLKFFHQTLTASEISQLLEVMCFDNRIEKVIGEMDWGYKAKRQTLITEQEENVGFMPPGSGNGGGVLSEVPCGRCPVFDLCEEGGPVGPSSCVYFTDWLEGLER